MKLKVSLHQLVFFIILSFFFNQKTFSQCFQIESILVDACDDGLSPNDEGFNEMVRFKVGPAAINTSGMNVTWPTAANLWKGLIQNATTALNVTALNTQITSSGGCGLLIEPTSGVLPANAKVILVSSQNFDVTRNYFGAITENIYIIFQNNTSNKTGNFVNYGTNSPLTKTLSMSIGGCSDSVTYDKSKLLNINGGYGPDYTTDPINYGPLNNGATVNFTSSGAASYTNKGCLAPVDVFSVNAGTSPISACPGATISLSGTAQSQQSVAWTAPSGSFSSPSSLITNYTIDAAATGSVVLTLTATNLCAKTKPSTITVNISSGAAPTISCGTISSFIQFTWPAVVGATGYSVSYQIENGAPTAFVAIGNVSNYTVSSLAPGTNVTITVLPTGGAGTCFNSASKLCTTTGCTSPVLTITNPASTCSPFTIDLTFPYVTAGSTGGGVLSYWTDSAATISLTNPTTINVSGTYYIKSTSGTCSDIKPVVVVVNPIPILFISNPPAAVCFPATVDITLPSITLGSVTGTVLTYWQDFFATVPLINPNAISVSGTYYIKSSFPTCSIGASVVVTINTAPVLTITNPAAICSPGTADITLPAITAGSTGSGTLTYWTDAAATNSLANPTTINTSGTYYIKSTSGTCSDVKPVTVTITSGAIAAPIVVSPVYYCKNSAAIALQATALPGATLKWYGTSATGGTSTGAAPIPSTATVGSITYYVSQIMGSCESSRSAIVVNVVANTGGLLTLFCDAAHTTSTSVAFDWNNVTGYLGYNYSYSIAGAPPVTGYQLSPSHFDVPVSGPGISVKFEILSVVGVPCVPSASITCNSSCATTLTPNFSPISFCSGASAPALSNTSPNGISGIWSPAIISNTITGDYWFTPNATLFPCAIPQKITVTVDPKIKPTFTAVAQICSGETLSPLPLISNNFIAGTWSPPLDNSATKTYTFEPTIGQCAEQTTLEIVVDDNKPINLDYYLCINKAGQVISPITIDTGLSPLQYSFAWDLNGSPISATTSFYEVSAVGIYTVTATSLSGACTKVTIATVKESNEATAVATVGADFDNQQQIIVTVTGGLGGYLYQIEDGLPQSSNIFTVSKGGEYKITIIDNVGCNDFSLYVNVLNYPRFFTPNGDNFNETWNISGLPNPEKAFIYIFDRYGKLLKEISPQGFGWDGIYCGKELPSTDYWFKLLYQDNLGANKEFKAHFTLKR